MDPLTAAIPGFAEERFGLHAHFLAAVQGAFQGKYVVTTVDERTNNSI
jgi:hypothetical protein